YMGAVQAIAGRGGWPMSVWLAPDLKPFYGGTYFPRESRYGFPGFLDLLLRIAEAWRKQRAAVLADAGRLAEALRRSAQPAAGATLPGAQVLDEALAALRQSFDPAWGGFGQAPKFPPFLAVDLLLRRGGAADRTMALRTLDAMAAGGIFDHLGGGFARYSVDERWHVPHFEKMLYDNAQLASLYLTAFQATGQARHAQVARACLDYLLRDMQDEGGGFHASEDADSEGEEGRFYLFDLPQVQAVLGDADGRLFAEAFGIGPEPGVLHRFNAPSDLAARHGLTEEGLEEKLDRLRGRLREARDLRPRPGRDDKVLASWNGLALSAMARGCQVLGDGRYLDGARACAAFLERELFRDGTLLRTWRRGVGHTAAFLEDHAAVILGLVDLYETTFDAHCLVFAERLAGTMRERFEDPVHGGFFSTEAGQQDLILRQKHAFDQALSAANALAVKALLRLGHQLQRDDFITSAEKALAGLAPLVEHSPRSCLGLLEGLEWILQGPLEVVVAGRWGDPYATALVDRAWSLHLARRVLAFAPEDGADPGHAGKVPIDGKPAAYVCSGRTCREPVTTPDALSELLSARQF
ncbi:MAG TPA: thioredoxin domain-containing protein, partial [Holophaga sp.]|nr:thioredoxin domain-containing protein [Holophaga sp.]